MVHTTTVYCVFVKNKATPETNSLPLARCRQKALTKESCLDVEPPTVVSLFKYYTGRLNRKFHTDLIEKEFLYV